MSFSVPAWVSGTFVLPLLVYSDADRWVLAAGAAFAGLGKWWATWEEQAAGGEVPAHSAVPAAGGRGTRAGGDISGIASTGDDTISIQRR
jgi:hypothetical protein